MKLVSWADLVVVGATCAAVAFGVTLPLVSKRDGGRRIGPRQAVRRVLLVLLLAGAGAGAVCLFMGGGWRGVEYWLQGLALPLVAVLSPVLGNAIHDDRQLLRARGRGRGGAFRDDLEVAAQGLFAGFVVAALVLSDGMSISAGWRERVFLSGRGIGALLLFVVLAWAGNAWEKRKEAWWREMCRGRRPADGSRLPGVAVLALQAVLFAAGVILLVGWWRWPSMGTGTVAGLLLAVAYAQEVIGEAAAVSRGDRRPFLERARLPFTAMATLLILAVALTRRLTPGPFEPRPWTAVGFGLALAVHAILTPCGVHCP